MGLSLSSGIRSSAPEKRGSIKDTQRAADNASETPSPSLQPSEPRLVAQDAAAKACGMTSSCMQVSEPERKDSLSKLFSEGLDSLDNIDDVDQTPQSSQLEELPLECPLDEIEFNESPKSVADIRLQAYTEEGLKGFTESFEGIAKTFSEDLAKEGLGQTRSTLLKEGKFSDIFKKNSKLSDMNEKMQCILKDLKTGKPNIAKLQKQLDSLQADMRAHVKKHTHEMTGDAIGKGGDQAHSQAKLDASLKMMGALSDVLDKKLFGDLGSSIGGADSGVKLDRQANFVTQETSDAIDVFSGKLDTLIDNCVSELKTNPRGQTLYNQLTILKSDLTKNISFSKIFAKLDTISKESDNFIAYHESKFLTKDAAGVMTFMKELNAEITTLTKEIFGDFARKEGNAGLQTALNRSGMVDTGLHEAVGKVTSHAGETHHLLHLSSAAEITVAGELAGQALAGAGSLIGVAATGYQLVQDTRILAIFNPSYG